MIVWKPNMSLTKDDVESIKGLLDRQKTGIIKEVRTVETNLTGKINTLREEVRTIETNLAGKIDKLRDETIEAIGDLADQFAIQKEVDGLSRRVEKLEHLQKTS